jgi:putative endonuclease
MTGWTVYIVRCIDGSLYTGIAKDAVRRVAEHNSNNLLAASYTRARRPVVLVYQEITATRSTAGKREYQIKQMSHLEKEALVVGRSLPGLAGDGQGRCSSGGGAGRAARRRSRNALRGEP